MSEGGNRGVQWELRGGRGVLLGTVEVGSVLPPTRRFKPFLWAGQNHVL